MYLIDHVRPMRARQYQVELQIKRAHQQIADVHVAQKGVHVDHVFATSVSNSVQYASSSLHLEA